MTLPEAQAETSGRPLVELVNEQVTNFDRYYGLVFESIEEDRVAASVVVRDEVRQPFGVVHGGVYASIAEGITSIGTAIAVRRQGKTVMGMSNSSRFLRPIRAGRINAVATPRHRGRTTWVWDVDFTDDDGGLCAISRMTVAVLEPRK